MAVADSKSADYAAFPMPQSLPLMAGRLRDADRAFVDAVSHLRTRLHRYCSRMTGSTFDGEDVMQDVLFEACRKLEMLDDPGALTAWIFRIAHNRAIDFLRARATQSNADQAAAVSDLFEGPAPAAFGVVHAIEHLVTRLPAMERACILLKDVFDHSLSEIADLVGSNIGAVKSALSRGRAKLQPVPPGGKRSPAPPDRKRLRLLELYTERFNRHDWDGIRSLTSADARSAGKGACESSALCSAPAEAVVEDARWHQAIQRCTFAQCLRMKSATIGA